MDQPTVGTGGIVGLDNAADTFAKQYVLSYYHQFNSSTILEAQFGHVDLTHNLNVVYSHLAGVYCELSRRDCKRIFVSGLQALLCLTHVGYYDAIAPSPRVLTKACWARVCCEST